MSKRQAPNLKVIAAASASSGVSPPGKLGETGMSLWGDITASYEFGDRASYETLYQACAAADRAERLRDLIDEQGEVVKLKGGLLKDHPALKHEIACRAFVCRTLARLGLDLEPLNAGPGRPTVR
jgi:hypothetical protein